MDRKKRVLDAVADYIKRQQPKPKRKIVQREEPVVIQIQAWAKSQGLMLRCYESKAIKKVIGGRVVWQNSGLDYGTPDLMGTGSGYTIAIEVKAPGKRATLRPQQRKFLVDTINQGGFGVVADDVDWVSEQWRLFLVAKRAGNETRDWLTGLLPLMPGRESFDV